MPPRPPLRLACFPLVLLCALVAAQPSGFAGCRSILSGASPPACSALANSTQSTARGSIVVTPARAADLCFLRCVVCDAPFFLAWQLGAGGDAAGFCADPASPAFATADEIVSNASAAVLNSSALHGWTWLDDEGDVEANATQSVAVLVGGLPRRDMLLLASDSALFVDFLLEHVRYALRSRAWSAGYNVSWQLFADAVLPYAILDEKRDLWFRWRPRFARLFRDVTAGAATITDAMHALAQAVPRAAALGALALVGGDELEVVPGQPISWHSSVSPAYISVEQVAAFGGSCTGTAVVLVAAARAVGIPARLAGCGESGTSLDDHHWM